MHASKEFDCEAPTWLVDWYKNSQVQFTGGIIGMSEILDVVIESESLWFSGPVGFVLGSKSPIRFIPMSGKLGLFKVPKVNGRCVVCMSLQDICMCNTLGGDFHHKRKPKIGNETLANNEGVRNA